MNNYKAELNEVIDELRKEAPKLTREQRIERVQEITDAYVEQTGERPDPSALSRLADVILHEELTDRNPDKMTKNEYPFMSSRQECLRREGRRREKSKRTGTVTREVPLAHASNVASNGKNYTLPIRSFKNPF